MRCASCSTELIPGKRFCHACGARVALACPSCGAQVEADFRFCADCGARLGTDAPTARARRPGEDAFSRLSQHIPEGLASKIRAAQGVIEGERKQVTVLFCDLSDSTTIAERLDPEEYHGLLEQYLELAFREIYRHEGIVNQLAGDGIMALFGAPVAHEDAPQRAVWAALGVHEALTRLNQRLHAERGIELRARIGVHTGPVVVGTVGNDLKMDYTAIGDTTNLAARLESLAEPGTVLISEATARLVRGFFHLRPVGPLTVRGKREAVSACVVLGPADAITSMAIAAERGLTAFVDREEELAELLAAYRRLAGGRAQVVAVVGEAGSGKSRLLYEFRRRVEEDELTVLEAHCSSLSQGVPYFPFLAMFRQYVFPTLGAAPVGGPIVDAEGEEAHRARLYPVLAKLLSASVDELRQLPPEELKRQSYDAIARLFLDESRRAPVVVMIEDLHWIDDPSRELLETLVARLVSAPIMIVVSHRPDDRAHWRARAPMTQIVLGRLSDDAVRAIIRAVAGGPLPAELERRLVARAEGSPFFAEEMTRALIEEGYLGCEEGVCRLTRPAEEIPVPGTVQEVIAARLDRLTPAAKRVIQVAAVLGRQFRRPELAQLLQDEGIDVAGELAELESRGLVHRKSLLAGDEYRFGESLTQEVAYETLLLRQRRQLHERIGLLLEAIPGEVGTERSALLAHHFGRSDNRPKAVAALLHAAGDAERLPAYRSAVDLYRQAWEVAEAALAEGDDDHFRAAVLQATAGLCRVAVIYGLPVPESERAAARARELAEAAGDVETLSSLYYFQGTLLMQGDRGQHAQGLALAERGLLLAQQSNLTVHALRLSRGLAIQYALDGRFALARRVADWAVDELERLGERERLTDLYISSRWVQDSVLLLSDEFDTILARTPETYDLAVRGPNRTVQGAAAGTLAHVYLLRGDYRQARHWADVSVEMAETIGHALVLPASAAVAALSRLELGEPVDAARYLEALDQGLAVTSNTSLNVRFLGEALLALGDRDRAERYAESLRTHSFGGRLRSASVGLALGELMSRFERLDEAERYYAEAIATADALGARTLLALASLGTAELLAARDHNEDGSRLATRALAICRELGLARYEARATRLAIDAAALAG